MKLITTLLLVCSLTGGFCQQMNTGLQISPLRENFYVYTTYGTYKGYRVPANGMYVVTDEGVILFDTPWDTTQFQPLLDSIGARHQKKVILCIATHFHEDRTGGLEYYAGKGIATYTTGLTDEWSGRRGMKRAEHLIEKDSLFQIGQYKFQTYYPGAGHAPDNIVIWFEKQKVLYGGCLIKSVADTNLGNLSDGDRKEYATTIDNVVRTYRKPKYVIVGHNDWRSGGSLKHTLKMALQLR